MEKTGWCEWLQCPDFVDKKCVNTLDYVNPRTGERMCYRNSSAIPREEWLANQEDSADVCVCTEAGCNCTAKGTLRGLCMYKHDG